jgi:hypothetical protein
MIELDASKFKIVITEDQKRPPAQRWEAKSGEITAPVRPCYAETAEKARLMCEDAIKSYVMG